MRDTVVRKLQQATCDKPELDRRFLIFWSALREVEKTLKGDGKSRRGK